MLMPSSYIKAMLTKHNLIKYLTIFILYNSVIFITILFSYKNIYKDLADNYLSRLHTVYITEGLDVNLMCNVVNCKSMLLVEDNLEFINIEGILKPTTDKYDYAATYLDIFNKDLSTVINYKDIIFIIDDQQHAKAAVKLYTTGGFVLYILYTIGFMFYVRVKQKEDIVEKSLLQSELESRLQRNLTESINHEMGMPVALIDTLITDLYSNLYPDAFTDDGVCILDTPGQCLISVRNRAVDKVAIEYYRKIKLGIVRMNSVLSLISESKHIKYNNGTVSLYAIVTNIVSSVNSFKVNKITSTYENEELFHNYAVGGNLNNGNMLNVINMMVNNSIEAKSSSMSFKAELISDNIMHLYIGDNGRGIRDKFNNIIENNYIFNYGYTTKDADGNSIILGNGVFSIIYKIVSKLGINITGASNVPRGVGLSVNRDIMQKSGGDILLHKTSLEGTVFKLILPVKKRRVD